MVNNGGFSQEDIDANKMGANFGNHLSNHGNNLPSLFIK